MANRTTKKTNSSDGAKWLKALAELQQSDGDKVPAGWRTSATILKGGQLGKSESTVMHKLSRLVKAEKVEKKLFRIMNGGRILPVPHYRLRR